MIFIFFYIFFFSQLLCILRPSFTRAVLPAFHHHFVNASTFFVFLPAPFLVSLFLRGSASKTPFVFAAVFTSGVTGAAAQCTTCQRRTFLWQAGILLPARQSARSRKGLCQYRDCLTWTLSLSYMCCARTLLQKKNLRNSKVGSIFALFNFSLNRYFKNGRVNLARGLSVGDRLNRMRELGSRPAIRFHEVLRRNSARNTGIVLIMHGPCPFAFTLWVYLPLSLPFHPLRFTISVILHISSSCTSPDFFPVFLIAIKAPIATHVKKKKKISIARLKIFIRFVAPSLCSNSTLFSDISDARNEIISTRIFFFMKDLCECASR
ncbi:hypothetical protein PUN28_004010 [Cardiocondyla obscurior]|uniref:Uncharacterized protein n=1 Tax=Cardiocondyla obscurior TaxID=286306 RepID=A0AAW2GMV1_9HYME